MDSFNDEFSYHLKYIETSPLASSEYCHLLRGAELKMAIIEMICVFL